MKPSAATAEASRRAAPRRLTRREACLLYVAVVLVAAALLLPAGLGQGWDAPGHFADLRGWSGLPNALDVLSNLPFLALGVLGLRRLHRLECRLEAEPQRPVATRAGHDELPLNALDCAWLFFGGLILVAAASVFYHLLPGDSLRLAGDRAAMTVAFAGLLGMAACDRISPRAGWPVAWTLLAAGLLSVAISQSTGNVVPWAVVQFGGMGLVLGMAMLRPVDCASAAGMRLNLGWVIALYAVAKLCELADASIYEGTAHLVSGHSLKHVAAALAALPVLQALRGLDAAPVGHNRAHRPVTI